MTTAATVAPSPRRGEGVRGRLRDWGPPALLLVGFLVVWELAVRVFQIEQFILPSPIAIAVAWQTYLPELLAAARYTSVEIVAGLIIGSATGILPIRPCIGYELRLNSARARQLWRVRSPTAPAPSG